MMSSHFAYPSLPRFLPFQEFKILIRDSKNLNSSSYSSSQVFLLQSNSSAECAAPHCSQFQRRQARAPRTQATSGSDVSTAAPLRLPAASEVVMDFYDGINRRDLGSVEALIGEDCVYEDLIFSKPFAGRKAILEFFKKFTESISSELQFVIDDISSEDTSAVGVTWHLERRGRSFPFSKGCSFYRLEVSEGTRKIIYARDCVEPAVKPGAAALVIISAVTWLLQRFPQLAENL